MRDALLGAVLATAILVGGTAMVLRQPTPHDPRNLTALQVDDLRARFPEGELELPYRYRVCRDGVWWYFYANHDAIRSANNCW